MQMEARSESNTTQMRELIHTHPCCASLRASTDQYVFQDASRHRKGIQYFRTEPWLALRHVSGVATEGDGDGALELIL